MQPNPYDPHETVWGAVAELEKNGFTKREIHKALVEVMGEYGTEGHQERE